MAIHHATTKKAQAENIVLTEDQGNERPVVIASFVIGKLGYDVRGVEGEKAADVLADALAMRLIKAEYAELQPVRGAQDGVWSIEFDDQTFDGDRLRDVLDQVLAHAEENALDIGMGEEQDEADEEERGASMVPTKYRVEYRERGNANHCSDWLACIVDPLTRNEDKTLDVVTWFGILDANDIDHSKWDGLVEYNRGQMRMTTGNQLRKKVGQTGVLVIPATGDADDQEIECPEHVRQLSTYRPAASKAKEAGDKKGAKRAASKKAA